MRLCWRKPALLLVIPLLVLAGCSAVNYQKQGKIPSSYPAAPPSSTPSPVSSGTYSLIQEPQDGYQPIYSLLSSAQHSLIMTMYELQDTTAEQILSADVQRGVQVKVLLDKDYSGGRVNQAAYSFLQQHGVSVRWALPDTIFHQKTFLVDDRLAVIGTGNLTSKYYPSSIDAWVVSSNREDIAAISNTFAKDWAGEAGPPPGTPGTNLVWSPGAQAAMVGEINSASSSVMFESEELSDSAVVNALAADARRGVRCWVLMTASSRWDSSFSKVTSAGCKVHVFPYSYNTAVPYVHEKAIIVDMGKQDESLLIGSTNASKASLTYNRELSVHLTLAAAPQVVPYVASNFVNNFSAAPVWSPS